MSIINIIIINTKQIRNKMDNKIKQINDNQILVTIEGKKPVVYFKINYVKEHNNYIKYKGEYYA